MKDLDLVQGTEPWATHRATSRNASEAPVMMGASKKARRNDLLRLRATGSEKEFSQWVEEVLFARGHEVERLARPLAEEIIGAELYPVTGVSDDGYLSASFDGLTMDESTVWECKQFNEEKAAAVRAGQVPAEDYWQCVQQLDVSGAQRLLYMVSDGTRERTVSSWVEPRRQDFIDLRAGWAQFDADLAGYVPSASVQTAVAEATEALPAVTVRMDGSIAVISNLDVFGERLKTFVAAVDRRPETDQGFANCEAAVKTLKKAEEALEGAEAAALAQIDPVEAMRRTVANYRELARSTRLVLEKVVKTRKDEIRVEIQQKALTAWTAHVAAVNKRLGVVRITVPSPDFAGAMRGKKTIDSLRGAVDDLLAKSKIEANAEADAIAANLAIVDDLMRHHHFLIGDLQALVTINPEHLAGVLKGRISEHEKAQATRLEAERARIRIEERAKAQQEAPQASAAAPPQKHTPEGVKPASAAAGPASVATQRAGAARPPASPQKPARPTDAEIIEVLSLHFRVHESKVIEWLLEMDLDAASAEMAKEFSL